MVIVLISGTGNTHGGAVRAPAAPVRAAVMAYPPAGPAITAARESRAAVEHEWNAVLLERCAPLSPFAAPTVAPAC
jgi:hypothetical protein